MIKDNKIIKHFENNLYIYLPFCVVITLIMVFAVGFVWGGSYACAANNGTLLGNGDCILDKCLEDVHVCKQGSQYLVTPKMNITIEGLEWT